MQIIRFRSLDDLAPWAAQWNQLARENPFRSWEWSSAWWRHYAQDGRDATRELCVLAAIDGDSLLGIAPWYLERFATKGNVLQFVGSGAVCAEYLSVLCRPGHETAVTGALAEWLYEQLAAAGVADDGDASTSTTRWDLLELSSVDADDRVVALLADELTARGCSVHRRDGMPCWRLELSTDWETYLMRLSKPVRRKIRHAEKDYFDTGRTKLHTLTEPADFPRVFHMLVELHQQRRQSLGDPGCFASPEFKAFHCEFAERMLARGRLALQWLELERQPVAIEYQLLGDQTLYAYQSGLDPALIEHQPGHLASIATLRQAIEQGVRTIDFLRGDEPYKSQFRADPRPIHEISIVPPTAAARLRFGVRAAGDSVKSWIKSGLELAGVTRTAEV